MRLGGWLAGVLPAQRGALFNWVPVMLGLGIGLYFALPAEPGPWGWGLIAAAGLVAAGLGWRLREEVSPLAVAAALVAGGLCLAGARAAMVAEPVLGFRYYGPVEGRVVTVDRSASDAVRVLLDEVVLENMPPARTPARVRISLLGPMDWLAPEPGLRLIVTAHLSPPAGPAEPGDFDFRRHAWFERLGATGYARSPALVLEPAAEGRAGLLVERLRLGLSAAITARIAGDAGGFAAAVTTGDRSGLTRAADDAMRASNLYHLVSISGMHMAMLSAFVFALVRGAVSLVPPLALRVSSKKVAALVALPVSLFYLLLAGRDIATERAFITVAVALGAVLVDRRAISMRSVALSALVVLLLRPESLVNAGFQMSFAAVVALVAVFGALGPAPGRGLLWRGVMAAAFLLLSSLVAGMATAPFAAAHFNRVAWYGLAANLLAVPAMGMLVMPGAVIAALLAPLGLQGPGLLMMDLGSRWILLVAEGVAALPGAMSALVTPPPMVLPLIAFGMLMLALWQRHGRWAGLLPCLAAFLLWQGASRPALLVSESGGLVGVMTPEGRALSRVKTDSFEAATWLENDGSLRTQPQAAALAPFGGDADGARLTLAGVEIIQIRGKTALEALEGCGGAGLLITNIRLRNTTRSAESFPCEVWDAARLARSGALALDDEGGALVIRQARQEAGNRLWAPQ